MKLQFKTYQGMLRWVLTTPGHIEPISHDQAARMILRMRRALLCRLN
ncbi:hypothetical protein [Celerinatantimonas sp. MCCC 1A17872]